MILNKNYFLAMDLNSNEELCLRGPIDKLIKSLPSKVKREKKNLAKLRNKYNQQKETV